jgi:hypothetical protein
VCANSTQSSLCDYYWNPVDAQVYCRYFLSLVYGVPASANISKELSTHENCQLSGCGFIHGTLPS